MKNPLISLLLTPLLALSFFSTVHAQTLTDTITDPAASTCVNLTKDMRTGSKDSTTDGQVSDLQFFLSDKGYLKTDPTGYFGPATLAAVKAFQADNSVPQTGNVGPLTRSKVTAVSCSNDEPISISLNPVDPVSPTSIGNLSVGLSYAGKDAQGNAVTIPSGSTATNISPFAARTWSWTTAGAASVSARYVISGANCAVSAYGDLKQDNWQPWVGSTVTGTRFNGTNVRTLGSQYYGCTVLATYTARNTQGQSVSSSVKVVFADQGSIAQTVYTCNGVQQTTPCTVVSGGPVCGQPPMPTCPAGLVCAQVMPQPKTYTNKTAMLAESATYIHAGACDGVTAESVVTNNGSASNVSVNNPSFTNLTFTPSTVSSVGAVNVVWDTSNTTATDGSGVKVTCDNATTGPSASSFSLISGTNILPISGDRNFSMATHFPGTYTCTAEVVRNGTRVGQTVTRTLTITQATAAATAPTLAPGIALFYVDNNSPRVGDKLNLYWNAEGGANNCTVRGSQAIAVGEAVQFNVTIPVNNAQGGTFETTFSGETKYSLFCTNSIGSSATKSFVVKPATLVGGVTIEDSPSSHNSQKWGSVTDGAAICIVPAGGTGCSIVTTWKASNDTSSVALKSFGGTSVSTLSTSISGTYTFGPFTPDNTKSWKTGYTLTTQPGGTSYKRILGAECIDKTYSAADGSLISPATTWNGTSCVVVGGDTTPATISSFTTSPTQIGNQMGAVTFMWSSSGNNCSVTHKDLNGSVTQVSGYNNSGSGFTTLIAEDAVNVNGNIARYTLVCSGANGQLSTPKTVDILFPNKTISSYTAPASSCSVSLNKSSIRTDESFVASVTSSNLIAVQYLIGDNIQDTNNFTTTNGNQTFDPISAPGTYSAKITGLRSDGTKINCSNSPVTFTVTAAPAAQTPVNTPVTQNPAPQTVSSSCSVSAPSSIFFTAAFDANVTSSNMSSVSYSLDNATWQPFSTKNGSQKFPANAFPDPGVVDSPKAYTLYFKGVSSSGGGQDVSCSPSSMTMSVKH